MAKGNNLVQDAAKTAGNTQSSVPMRHLSQESAGELRVLASRSPEKLRKILERLASLAGESANATSRDK
ncbi:hypothetical protein D3C72_2115900 [compost metagenome]